MQIIALIMLILLSACKLTPQQEAARERAALRFAGEHPVFCRHPAKSNNGSTCYIITDNILGQYSCDEHRCEIRDTAWRLEPLKAEKE